MIVTTKKILKFRTSVPPYLFSNDIRKTITSKATEKKIAECYRTLNLPLNSKQAEVRNAFFELAKKYHPDSGSPEANVEQFVAIENAFRILTKHNTGASSTAEDEKMVFDIKHTAPQHRQYLSFDGVGHGTPSQRMRQYTQARAQKAAENVLEHRMSKAVASDKSLMKKGDYAKKHDIKTKYGFDRLVEDLIQESISKGEFENLSGKGKPLKDQNINPYVDYTTHKLNEVLINNGFTPEWIMMNKEIENDIKLLKDELLNERAHLGPNPMSEPENKQWVKICEDYKESSKRINLNINKYNLIVPLLNKQRLHINFDKIAADVLKNGAYFDGTERNKKENKKNEINYSVSSQTDDFMGMIFKAIGEIFKKKNIGN